jgi:hypothetical protein
MALCNIRKGEIIKFRERYIPRSSAGDTTEKNRTLLDMPANARGRIVKWQGSDIYVNMYRNAASSNQTPFQVRIPISQFHTLFEPSTAKGWPALERITNPADF